MCSFVLQMQGQVRIRDGGPGPGPPFGPRFRLFNIGPKAGLPFLRVDIMLETVGRYNFMTDYITDTGPARFRLFRAKQPLRTQYFS